MAYLNKAKKKDLLILATELAVEVSTRITMMDLKQCIIKSKDYDEEFTVNLLNSIIEDREEEAERRSLRQKEEVKRQKEDEDRECVLQMLRLEIAQMHQSNYSMEQNSFCKSTPRCYDCELITTGNCDACSRETVPASEIGLKQVRKNIGENSFLDVICNSEVSSSDSFLLHANEGQDILLVERSEMKNENLQRMDNNDDENKNIFWDTIPKCYACGKKGYVRSQCPECSIPVLTEHPTFDSFNMNIAFETRRNVYNGTKCSSFFDCMTDTYQEICHPGGGATFNFEEMYTEDECRIMQSQCPAADVVEVNDKVLVEKSKSDMMEQNSDNSKDIIIYEVSVVEQTVMVDNMLSEEEKKIVVDNMLSDEEDTEIAIGLTFQNMYISYDNETSDGEVNLHVDCEGDALNFTITEPNEPDFLLKTYQEVCHQGGDAAIKFEQTYTEDELSTFVQNKCPSAGYHFLSQDMVKGIDGKMAEEVIADNQAIITDSTTNPYIVCGTYAKNVMIEQDKTDSLLNPHQKVSHPVGDATNNLQQVDLSVYVQIKYFATEHDELFTYAVVKTDGIMDRKSKSVQNVSSDVLKPGIKIAPCVDYEKHAFLLHKTTYSACTSAADEISGYHYVNAYPPERDKATSLISLQVWKVQMKHHQVIVRKPIALLRRRGRPPRFSSVSSSGRLRNQRGSL